MLARPQADCRQTSIADREHDHFAKAR